MRLIVAGILPKCRRHVGNIPATEGNKMLEHYVVYYSSTLLVVIGGFARVTITGPFLRCSERISQSNQTGHPLCQTGRDKRKATDDP